MIEKFNEWYEGVFDNREQAFGRPVHFIYVRITHVKLDNGFFMENSRMFGRPIHIDSLSQSQLKRVIR